MQDQDAIIIGSGSGGLIAALALARTGRRVVVIEQHHLPGGSLRRIYEGLGVANDLVFLELDPDGYDRVLVGDRQFDIPAGRERFAERLCAQFPGEAAGITGYMDTVHRMAEELAWTNPKDLSDWLHMPLRSPTILRHGWQPLASYSTDPRD